MMYIVEYAGGNRWAVADIVTRNRARNTNCEVFFTGSQEIAQDAADYLNQPVEGLATRRGAHWLKSTFGVF